MENFEDFCRNCDHFPGDDKYDKREYWDKCPFKEKFLNKELNGDTKWKEIKCTNFWD